MPASLVPLGKRNPNAIIFELAPVGFDSLRCEVAIAKLLTDINNQLRKPTKGTAEMDELVVARTRVAWRYLTLIVSALTAIWFTTGAANAVTCPGGKTMNIVAHEDDDVIFFGTAAIADYKANRCVRTVYVTAGDAGSSNLYWNNRELGAVRAHARMLGIAATTTNSSINSGPHKIALKILSANPRSSMVYLRLPDGGQFGGGFDRNAGQSLKKLWYNEIASLSTVADANFDGLANVTSYDKRDLFITLREIMVTFRPDKISIQNYVRDHATLNDDSLADHSDHLITARFAYQAAKSYAWLRGIKLNTLLTGYLGYEVFRYPQNVFGADLAAKNAAFRAYGHYDRSVCANRDCSSFDEIGLGGDWWGYPRWMSRQYVVTLPASRSSAFEIRGLANKCMDVRSAGTANGTPVQLYTCVNQKQQKWIYNAATKTLKDRNSGKCLTQPSATPANGTALSISTCVTDRATQRWKFTRDGEIVGAGGKCIQPLNQSASDGTRLVLSDCNYTQAQLWGYGNPATAQAPARRLETSAGGFCITSEPAVFSAVGAVRVRACSTSVAQLWRFAPSKRLRGPNGKCLSIQDADGVTNGKDIILRPCDLLADTVPVVDTWLPSDGSATNPLVSNRAGKCLDLRGNVNANGTVIQSSDCIDQRWLAKPAFPNPP